MLNLARQPVPEDKLRMFRDKAHKITDDWVDSLAPALCGDKPLTMEEISALFEEKKAELMGSLVTNFIAVHHSEDLEQQTAPCPQCEKVCKAKRQTSRRVDSRQGSSLLERPYFYCRDCGVGFSPLDQTLQLSARRKQYDLQRLALDYVAEMPFSRAAELLSKSTGVSFSDQTLHDFLAEFTDGLTVEEVLPTAEDIADRISKVRGKAKRRPVLVVATDGAHLPTRPLPGRSGKRGKGAYKEAKGFRLYLVGNGNRIVQLVSWHQMQDAEQCAAALKTVAERIPVNEVRIALVGDGAHWLWSAMTEAFPSGREVLDYYHCSEHVHGLAPLLYPEAPLKSLQWAEATMARLYYGEVTKVLGGLKRMQPKKDAVKEEIRKLIGYLENNTHRIDYAHNRRGGYVIGSGGIESANKFICHVRLKRSGAWWLKENGNGMLALRCALVNGTLDEAFRRYVARDQQERFEFGTNT
jgi:hypothetical protein